ncbi:unnamed protein product, partial [marine sediment metagenome]
NYVGEEMGLNKAGGAMYRWADWTVEPLAGRCPNDCTYCYIKSWPFCSSGKYDGPQRLWESEFKIKLSNLGINRREELPFVPADVPVVFPCSGNDLGAATTSMKIRILEWLCKAPENFYLLQSKNPAGLKEVEQYFPPNAIVGTTLETNRDDLCRAISNAPVPSERAEGMKLFNGGHYLMISVEPKMDCDPGPFAELIREVGPAFVSVGADSKKHNLLEPSAEKVLDLINRLEEFTVVKKKKNLGRLLKARSMGGQTS